MTTPLGDIDAENDSLDTFLLGGDRSPGKVTWSGHDRTGKWDIKDGDGQSGATATFKGDELAKPTASIYLVRDAGAGIDEVADFDDRFLPIIQSLVEGSKVSAKDIYHPDLARNGITSVSRSSVKGVVHDGKGGQTVVVEFLEYKPPKPKTGTPAGSSTKPAGAPNPNADVKKQLDDLLNTANNP